MAAQSSSAGLALAPAQVPEPAPDGEMPMYSQERHRKTQVTTLAVQPRKTDWRILERMKTSSVALVVCLNIGVDPPDVLKPSPCARIECWIDPFCMAPVKALESIGKRLQDQYERWQPRAKYKQELDPTVDAIKKLCSSLRRNAKGERVLFHYNGHGVPRPTSNGEIWVFNKTFTQYIPLSIYDLQSWLGTPSIYVFDCGAAGVIVNAYTQFMAQRQKPIEDCIMLAACSAGEILPQNPDFPADMFTACLTTPIVVGLRWFCIRSRLNKYQPDVVDKIPGRLNDRKSLLGELNWIFTAITDTIAWHVLPIKTFQRLFRQDLLVASLFRNFLLAERILHSLNCTPVSLPRLPPTHQHPLWQSWDLAADACLGQVTKMLDDPNGTFQHSPFFAEQLTAFEVWLDFGGHGNGPPQQLPIVLQVLLSQVHRLRALQLLARFLDKGDWAVHHALAVGIFPYVLKLLQSPAGELRNVLIFIWARILSFDQSCQTDLVKDGGHEYFIKFLNQHSNTISGSPEDLRPLAIRSICVIVDGYRDGQAACLYQGLLGVLASVKGLRCSDASARHWSCLCLAKLWEKFDEARLRAIEEDIPQVLMEQLDAPEPEVRAAALCALSTFLGELPHAPVVASTVQQAQATAQQAAQRTNTGSPFAQAGAAHSPPKKPSEVGPLLPIELELTLGAVAMLVDGSSIVRKELVVFLARFVQRFINTLAPLVKEGSERRNSGATNAFADDEWTVVDAEGNPANVHATAGSAAGAGGDDELSRGNSMPATPSVRDACRSALDALIVLTKDPIPAIANLATKLLTYVQVSAGVTPTANDQQRPAGAGAAVNGGRVSGALGGAVAAGGVIAPTSGVGAAAPPATPPRHTQSTGQGAGEQPVAVKDKKKVGVLRSLLVGVSSPRAQHQAPLPADIPDEPMASLSLDATTSDIVFNDPSDIVSDLYTWCASQQSMPLLLDNQDSTAPSQHGGSIPRALRAAESLALLPGRKIEDQVAILESEARAASRVHFHRYEPVLVVADHGSGISFWDVHQGCKISDLENRNPLNSRCTALAFGNCAETARGESLGLLFVGSDDGVVRVWNDPARPATRSLLAAWHALPELQPNPLGPGLVMVLTANRRLAASGDTWVVRVWDVEAERCVDSFLSGSQSCVTSLDSGCIEYTPSLLVSGCADGTIRLYDARARSASVATLSEHQAPVVNVRLDRAAVDSAQLISGSVHGDIKVWDLRMQSARTIEAHKEPMTALAVHDYAPVIAAGSQNQCVKIFTVGGDLLNTIRYHDGFLGQRIGPISSLAFHPMKLMLAAGATDSIVSIYAAEGEQIN